MPSFVVPFRIAQSTILKEYLENKFIEHGFDKKRPYRITKDDKGNIVYTQEAAEVQKGKGPKEVVLQGLRWKRRHRPRLYDPVRTD